MEEELIKNIKNLNIDNNKKIINLKNDNKKKIILNIDYINNRIKKEICYEAINKLKDENLLEVYKNQKSVKSKINYYKNILKEEDVEDKKIDNILNKTMLTLIPPGTKGVVRGCEFNKIVKEYILNRGLSQERFIIEFEKNNKLYNTNEIPDWYIQDKETNKVMIGMNQLDLWSGGQQINRGSKYVINDKQTKKNKLVSVVCNEVIIKSYKNKVYKLFNEGYKKNNLCYLNGLNNIINKFFNL